MHTDVRDTNNQTILHRACYGRRKLNHDRKTRTINFLVDTVFVRQSSDNSPWIPGTVVKKRGDLIYQVQLEDG